MRVRDRTQIIMLLAFNASTYSLGETQAHGHLFMHGLAVELQNAKSYLGGMRISASFRVWRHNNSSIRDMFSNFYIGIPNFHIAYYCPIHISPS